MDDFPPKRDEPFSAPKRDGFKGVRDDFKGTTRVVDIARGSSFTGSSSSRLESSSNIKDRFQDRSTVNESFHRGLPQSRVPTDDRESRNGSAKRGYLEPASESRFSDRSAAWNSSSSHPTFNISSSHTSSDLWPQKQSSESQSTGWRGNVDDRYASDRFSSSERKPVLPGSSFLDSSASHTTMRGGNQGFMTSSAILNQSTSRFSNNRYDNSRY